MASRKSERLMNLTICLLVSRTFISKERIRSAVEGYHGLSDDAFDRMFDRDKEELRVIGVPIETGSNDTGFDDDPGYRIRRDRYELPEVTLEADEAAVVGLAARVWQHAQLASASGRALRRLRAAGADVDESAVHVLEPRLDTVEAAFDPVFSAVTTRTPISFGYRTATATTDSQRRLEPWGIVSWHGHWYVVGFDQDRQAPRMFRLSRIKGTVHTNGDPGDFDRPAEVNLRDLTASLAPPEPQHVATLRVRAGSGDALRRHATRSREVGDGWTEVDVPYARESSLVEQLLALGPDVIAVEPVDVRQAVVENLQGVVKESR